MIWIAISVLTGIAALSVLVPLATRPGRVRFAEASRAFYDDQVAELARDRDRGLLSVGEYDGATAEAARRLITSHKLADEKTHSRTLNRRITAAIALIAIPGLALGMYAYLGSPQLEDRPLMARLNAPPGKIELVAAVAKIERHLANNPADGKGWQVIAPVYVRMKRYGDAAKAWNKTIQLLGPSAFRYTALGRAHFFSAKGKMTSGALQAFNRALAIDPKYHQALFFSGIAAEQAGDPQRARKIWSDLIAIAPAGAPWVKTIQDRLDRQGSSGSSNSEKNPNSTGPRSAAGNAIAALPPSERAAAISAMVDGLAARLKKNGNDLPGWLRLIRAYGVMKRSAKGVEALAAARAIFADDQNALRQLAAEARSAGVKAGP